MIQLPHLQRFSNTGRQSTNLLRQTSRALAVYPFPQEHQQAVEEEFGPENFVVVVRGLLDEAGRWLILVVLPRVFCLLVFLGGQVKHVLSGEKA